MGDGRTREELAAQVEALRRELEQARSEARTLDAADEIHRRMRDAMLCGVVRVDTKGAIVFGNAEAQRVLGLGYDELANKYVADFESTTVWEDGSPCNPADYPVTRAMATGEPQAPVTIGVRRPTGDTKWAVYTAVPAKDASGSVVGAQVTFVDITKWKNAEAALRASEARLRGVLESAPNFIFLVDREGRIQFANRGGGNVTTESLVGTFPWDRLEGQARVAVKNAVERVLSQGKVQELEVKSSSGLLYSMRAGPVRQGDEIVGASLIGWDVTELRALQTRALVSDRVSTMGLLAASVAHEINNPLTYVLANLRFLERFVQEHTGASDAREWVRSSLEGVERIRAIISDLRALSAPERSGGEIPLDVQTVLDASLRIAQAELGQRARVIREYAEVPPVLASDARLGQVFINLLVNAAHSIREGRASANTVRISTRCDEDGNVVVEIADTGCGIEPDLLDRIFDPFFTTKGDGRGTGLGLYICRSIVSSLKGTLTVTSTKGQGSVFRVTLPPAPVTSTYEAPRRNAAIEPPPPMRVLVVDDEPGITRVLRDSLQGHRVQSARSGREAMQMLEQEEFDMVVCDLVMPDVTGIDLYEHARARWPHMARRFVFMTGGAFTEDTQAFIDRVDNPVLDKPFTVRELLTVLTRQVRAASHDGAIFARTS